MSNFQRSISFYLVLILGALCAQSQNSFSDTIHITPAMLDSIRLNDTQKIIPFEHDIEKTVFIPKGQWIAGLSFSYSQSNQNNYQFIVFEDIDADTYSFKVSPMVGFAVRNDWVFGAKFSYKRSLLKLANSDLVLDAETSMNFDHVYSLSHNYFGTIFMRNYFSLGHSKRFGFFNEVRLEMGGGVSKLTQGVGENLSGTYEKNYSINIGLTPGLIMFLSNWSAIEINVGVLGFSYQKTDSLKDQIYHSNRHYKSANFKINLFSVTFGTTFYL